MNTPDADQDLGELDNDEIIVTSPNERRVVTQPLDLSVQTLAEQWENKTLILPDIQREYLWDSAKASRLIESLLLNIPIPVIYFAETDEAKYEIFDGHQRVRSIVNFLDGEFRLTSLSVMSELNGKSYSELPEREKRFLKMRTLRTIIISVESHPNVKFEIFERLNTGSILLNAQELRNSIYRGKFNQLLHELARDARFRDLIGSKSPRRRMVDEEIVLRFLAIRSHLSIYRAPLKRFLNDFMRANKDPNETDLVEYRRIFFETIQRVNEIFGKSAFRVTNAAGMPIESAVNRALFDAQMVSCSWITNNAHRQNLAIIQSNLFGLFSNTDFLDSIRRATGDRSRTLKRIRDTCTALSSAGVPLLIPFNLER